jgi:hypothetical protein
MYVYMYVCTRTKDDFRREDFSRLCVEGHLPAGTAAVCHVYFTHLMRLRMHACACIYTYTLACMYLYLHVMSSIDGD